MIELTKDYIENLKSIIEAKDDAKAQEVLYELYPADIAELYQELNLQEAIYLYLLMDGDKAADVLMELDEEDRHKLLKELPNELIAKRFVDNMETDDAVDLMRELDEDTQEEILSHIEDVEQAGDIVDLLKYDEDTAGGLMGTEMIVVNENWSMPKCIDEMRKQAEEMSEIYYVYVVDDDERLKGVLPLQKLITHPSVSKIKHVMKKDPISVRDSDSIEEVTETIEKYDLVALPVVDSIGRLVGRITIDDVMDEVREQHERDYQLASGISQDVETSDNVFTQTAARLPCQRTCRNYGIAFGKLRYLAVYDFNIRVISYHFGHSVGKLRAVDRKSTACTDLCFLCGFHRHRVHITHFFLKHTAGTGSIRTFQRITAHKLRKALVLMGRRILFRLHLAQPYMKASVCKRPRRLNSGKTCAYHGNSLFIQVYPILISFRSSYPHRQDAHIRSRPWRSIPDPACRPS